MESIKINTLNQMAGFYVTVNKGSLREFKAKVKSRVNKDTNVIGLDMEDGLNITFLAHIDQITID